MWNYYDILWYYIRLWRILNFISIFFKLKYFWNKKLKYFWNKKLNYFQLIMSRLSTTAKLLSALVCATIIAALKQAAAFLSNLNPVYNSPQIKVTKNILQYAVTLQIFTQNFPFTASTENNSRSQIYSHNRCSVDVLEGFWKVHLWKVSWSQWRKAKRFWFCCQRGSNVELPSYSYFW